MDEMLHPELKLVASERPANEVEIRLARERFPRLPDEYVDLMKGGAELEFLFRGKKYLRIWRPSGCIDMDDGYQVSSSIEGAIPVGDDGGGRVLCYWDGPQGWGLYRTSLSDLDPDDVIYIAPNLASLLGAPERFWK